MAIADMIKSNPLFIDMYDHEIEKVIGQCQVFAFKENEFIIRTGDLGEDIWIILEGKASNIVEEGSHRFEMESFYAGSLFGFTSLTETEAHSSSVVAVEDCQILKIPCKHLISLFSSDAKLFGLIALNLSRIMAHRMNDLKKSVHENIKSIISLQE